MLLNWFQMTLLLFLWLSRCWFGKRPGVYTDYIYQGPMILVLLVRTWVGAWLGGGYSVGRGRQCLQWTESFPLPRGGGHGARNVVGSSR